MMRKIAGLLVTILLIIGTGWILRSNFKNMSDDPSKVKVTTSFYPLYFFTKEIGGDKLVVHNITPAGAEPHDYEPTTSDIAQIEQSRALILNGAGLEPWSQGTKDILRNKEIKIVESGTDLAKQEVTEDGKTTIDPHVWLDPVLARKMVAKITGVLISVSPEDRDYFESNEKTLNTKLDQLDSEFRTKLKNCKTKNIITSHAAFGYLAREYGLKQISISGLSPDTEPSPKRMAEVADFAKQNGVKYIFFETLVSPKLAETIAKETGAQTLVFNPLEGLTKEDENKGKNYFSVQRDNLKNLSIALQCQ